MTATMLDVGVPTNTRYSIHFDTIYFSFKFISWGIHKIVRNPKIHTCIEICYPKPHLIILNQRKNFFVTDGIHISNNKELFLGSYYPRQELTEQREWRVGDNDIDFITQLAYFLAPCENGLS